MNHWTKLSIEYAAQRNYLDDLFQVYPTNPEGLRDVDEELWEEIEEAFGKRDNLALLKHLLKLKLFPLKDAYVAYLRRDHGALERNPATVARLAGRVYELELKGLLERSSAAKETNRQMGQSFRRWLRKGVLGIQPVPMDQFLATRENAILEASDAEMKKFAQDHLRYNRKKGLDFVARFRGTYVVGEAKFLTDFGGHQSAQFNDGVAIFRDRMNAVPIAILDGVLYIKGRHKMYREITGRLKNKSIMSALVLREFLYQL